MGQLLIIFVLEKDASDEEVEYAAKVAQAYPFIMEKENGFDEESVKERQMFRVVKNND